MLTSFLYVFLYFVQSTLHFTVNILKLALDIILILEHHISIHSDLTIRF